jgi:preprotein translocase subunit YajC
MLKGKDVAVGNYSGLIFLALPLLLLYMVFSRMRRQQRQMAVVQAAIAPGLAVMTTSGVHATVVSSDDDEIVVLEIAPGVHTRWARAAIAQVFDQPGAGEPSPAGTSTDEPSTDEPSIAEPSTAELSSAAPSTEATSTTEPHSIDVRTTDVPTRERDDRTLT